MQTDPDASASSPAEEGSSRAKTIRGILLGVVGVLLGVAILEGLSLLKIVDYREARWLSYNRFDPELMFIHRPYSVNSGDSAKGGNVAVAFQIPKAELGHYKWDVRYDDNGFRNATDLSQADIVAVGASNLEGVTVTDDQLFTTELARRLNKVVANLGQLAYSPQQDLIVLRRFGLPLKPKVVLWMFTDFNDLRQVDSFETQVRYKTGIHAILERSLTKNALLNFLREKEDAESEIKGLFVREPAYMAENLYGIIPNTANGPAKVYFRYSSWPLAEEEITALGTVFEDLNEADRLCSKRGIRLVVVFIPQQFRVYHGFVWFPPNSIGNRWVVTDVPERLRQGLQSMSPRVEFLDLTPALKNAVQDGILPYYKDDSHWNPAGHEIAAEAIASYLERNHN